MHDEGLEGRVRVHNVECAVAIEIGERDLLVGGGALGGNEGERSETAPRHPERYGDAQIRGERDAVHPAVTVEIADRKGERAQIDDVLGRDRFENVASARRGDPREQERDERRERAACGAEGHG